MSSFQVRARAARGTDLEKPHDREIPRSAPTIGVLPSCPTCERVGGPKQGQTVACHDFLPKQLEVHQGVGRLVPSLSCRSKLPKSRCFASARQSFNPSDGQQHSEIKGRDVGFVSIKYYPNIFDTLLQMACLPVPST